jgi:hypothetical protein
VLERAQRAVNHKDDDHTTREGRPSAAVDSEEKEGRQTKGARQMGEWGLYACGAGAFVGRVLLAKVLGLGRPHAVT